MRRALRTTLLVAAMLAATLPIGPCVAIAQHAAIEGFFNALNPLLIESFAQQLAHNLP